jgi:formaldehyde-activating enzyme involved in methanogenesis
MLKILGENYYLDLDVIDDYIQIKDLEPSPEKNDVTHISIVKYETIKLMLEVIMDEGPLVDEILGEKSSDLSIPFKLSFNTLLNKKIINKY